MVRYRLFYDHGIENKILLIIYERQFSHILFPMRNTCISCSEHTKISAVHVKGKVFTRCLSLAKCVWWSLFLLHERKCRFWRSTAGKCLVQMLCYTAPTLILISKRSATLWNANRDIEKVSLALGAHWRANKKIFSPTKDSYKVPNKTQRMCEAVTTVSSHSFAHFRTVYTLTDAL